MIIVIPFGLMQSAVETLRSVTMGANITSNFPVSVEFVTALQAELRQHGYQGEMLASELGLLVEYEAVKNE